MDSDTALKLGSALGGGLGRTGKTCGVITGALLVIGLRHGSTDAKDSASKEKTYTIAKEFIRQFKELNNSIVCRKLIGFDIGSRKGLTLNNRAIISRQCPKYISDSSSILEKLL